MSSTSRPHRKPAVRIATDFLNSYVQDHASSPGDRIAPARQLAETAGVSSVTMWNVLRELKEQGVLELTSRKQYRIASTPSPAPSRNVVPSAPMPESARLPHPVARAITNDILKGIYRQGKPLPSLTELQGRYQIAYRTLRKVLDNLIAQSILERLPNGHAGLPSPGPVRPMSRIVCFLPTSTFLTFSIVFGQNGEEIFRAFEVLCAQANVEIDYQLVYFDEDQGRYRLLHKKTGMPYDLEDLDMLHDNLVLGYVYYMFETPAPLEETAAETVVRWCLRKKRPVYLIDESAALKLPAQLTDSRLLCRFSTIGSSNPGKEIGRHLLAHGHRRIAYISAFPNYRWSQVRFEGLKSVVENAGLSGVVAPFFPTIQPGFEAGAQRFNMASLLRSFERWRSKIPPICHVDFNRAFETVRFAATADAEAHIALQILMEQALADSRITAWVMSGDSLASTALPFLKGKGVRVPADLSLISFDDSSVALRDHFSSYNFNHQATAAAMLGFILRRPPYLEMTGEMTGFGFIMNRGTISRAKERT